MMKISMHSFLFALFMLITSPLYALDMQEVSLPPSPALAHRTKTTAEKMHDEIKKAQTIFTKQLGSLQLKSTGFMMAEFLASSEGEYDVTFYMPVSEPQAFMMPVGKRLKFIHKGAYDLIDQTYEEIADELDEKKITAQDMVLEEYSVDINAPDNALQVNIYIAKKE